MNDKIKPLSLEGCKRLIGAAMENGLYDMDENKDNDSERAGNILLYVNGGSDNKDSEDKEGWYSCDPLLAAEILSKDFVSQQIIIAHLKAIGVEFDCEEGD